MKMKSEQNWNQMNINKGKNKGKDKDKNHEYLDFRKKANELINLDIISVLNERNMIIKLIIIPTLKQKK